MKTYITFLLWCLCSFCPFLLFAQNKPGTILWEVSKPGLPFKSYLFGTFHQVNPTFFDSLTIADEKLKSSTKLFVEAIPEQNSSVESLAIKNPMYAWNYGKWDSILTKPQKDTFAAFVKKSENPVYYSISQPICW